VLESEAVLTEIVAAIADGFSGSVDKVGESDEAEDGDEEDDRPERWAGEGLPDFHKSRPPDIGLFQHCVFWPSIPDCFKDDTQVCPRI